MDIPYVGPILRSLSFRLLQGANETTETEEKTELTQLEANLLLSCIETEENRNDASGTEDSKNVIVTRSKEQYLRIELCAEDAKQIRDYVRVSGYYHVIIAVDKSGSMAGSPMNQLKQALMYILQETLGQENLYLDIFLYDNKIHPLKYTHENFQEKVEEIKAGGLTYFSVVFDKIRELTKHKDKTGKEVRKTVVIFMTDGSDTSGKVDEVAQCKTKCAGHLKSVGHDTVVHVLGFSKDHDFPFLNIIKDLGSSEGVFRYCEPSDGPTALKEKMAELYDYINDMGKELLDIEVTISDNNKIVDGAEFTNTRTLRARAARAENEADEYEATNSEKEHRFYAESWLFVSNPDDVPEFEVKVYSNDGKTRKEVPCKVTSVKSKPINDAFSKVEWSLKILERNTDIVSAKIGETIAQKKDLVKVEQRLVKLQAKVCDTRVFDLKVGKDGRKILLDQIAEIQGKLDVLHKMIADVRRGESDSVSMLARANDLRYQVQFSKSRRQRLMDQRVRKNIDTMKKAQKELDSITVNQEQIKALSEDCEEFYMCTLSQMNVKEIMLDQSDREDCVGFGLAVKRAEHVLDEPTAIKIWAISGTLVSRSSMMDALEHKINIEGQLMAHGGFDIDSDLGVATVGQSREPINAWLPMYVCESHWNRVKVLIKPSLGYFCTLDPLGYNFKQIDVLFQVLGTMIGQLQNDSANEHKLKMIFGFQRLCRAILTDFDLIPQSVAIVKAFINSPVGRTKDIIHNLFVLVGYMVALPHENMEEIMGKSKDERKASLQGVMLSILSECMRRGAGNCFKESSDAKTDGILDALTKETTNSDEKKARLISNAEFLRALKLAKSTKANEVNIPDYEVDTGVTVPVIENPEKNIPSVDKAMELWAQAHCGVIRNKNREDQIKSAKEKVLKWVETGHIEVNAAVCIEQNAGEEEKPTETTEEPNWDHLDGETLQILIQLINKICGAMNPRLGNILGCMAFLEFWMNEQPDFCEMDSNSGIAPESWIQGVKAEVNSMQKKIDECHVMCEDFTEQLSTTEAAEAVTTAAKSKAGDGNEPQTENSGPAGDDNEDEELWEEFEAEDTPVTLLQKQWKEAKRKEASLGEVLICICVDKGDGNKLVTITRGLICQVVQYHRNAAARTAAADGQIKDFKSGFEAAIQTLISTKSDFKKRMEAAILGAVEKVFWQRANHAMLQAPTTWAFVGYLINTYKDRGEGISELVKFFTDPCKAEEIPCLEEKITVVIMGKWEDCAVIDNGNMWMPEKKMGKKFEKVLGEEVWAKIEVNLRSSIQIHVYRESDIPNRHGHCNSNPYIPNALRLKLGMALIKEKHKPNRLRSKLTR